MDTKISLVVPIVPSAAIDEVIDSIDSQSLKYDEFEVVLTELGAGDRTLNRLRRLVERRPNMRLVEGLCGKTGG